MSKKAKKLISFLIRSQIKLRWVYKAIFTTFLLYLVSYYNFHPLSVAIFVLAILVIYLREHKERKKFRKSFVILPLLALYSLKKLIILTENTNITEVIIISSFGVLFLLLLSLPSLSFSGKNLAYGIFSAITAFLGIVSIIYATSVDNLWINCVFAFTLFAALTKESLNLEGIKGKRATLLSFVTALIVGEVLWITYFLPINFTNSAALITLSFIVMKNTAASHKKGQLLSKYALEQTTIFVFIILIILSTTKWGI